MAYIVMAYIVMAKTQVACAARSAHTMGALHTCLPPCKPLGRGARLGVVDGVFSRLVYRRHPPVAILYSYGIYSYGLHSHGLYSCGLYSYGLYNHGLYSYGLHSYGLYNIGHAWSMASSVASSTVDSRPSPSPWTRRSSGHVYLLINRHVHL